MTDLHEHNLAVALYQPQIAPNTGNAARSCVATGTHLHLIRPLGFLLDDRRLRRSAMDYWPRLKLTIHEDAGAFFHTMHERRLWLFTSKSTRAFWDADFAPGDCLLFGNETQGLPEPLLARHDRRSLRIPQSPGERCLNLSTAVGIGLYEAIRQCQRR